MGYPTKVQVIRRARSQQFYVCFSSALAQAMDLEPSEVVEWVIESEGRLVLKRTGGQGRKAAKSAGKEQKTRK